MIEPDVGAQILARLDMIVRRLDVLDDRIARIEMTANQTHGLAIAMAPKIQKLSQELLSDREDIERLESIVMHSANGKNHDGEG